MSYRTVEVEIDHGRIVPKEPDTLPEKGSGLLTILASTTVETPKLTPLEALEALQKRLQLDEKKASDWMETIRDARR